MRCEDCPSQVMRARVPPFSDENPSNQLGLKNKMKGFNFHTKYSLHLSSLNLDAPAVNQHI